ncbi:MAG: hypothetical protein HON76_07700 [Candidatus Scalindua sp.]|jgi:hypothetical protein|nr:hypothetical protein [Candidatus Scalindua sp.]MBT6048101.1 hypothetical protein [Candidatus Scalindua sp.]MBT6227283.1 hypothetical protein [Candidatus Scalindua sp.]MBT6562395.1 hypothetical protein [Candidatus Scalindua sp.]MBT7209979.1 hypothetical protein [Candidatus Scalindua sp.]
MEVYDGFNWAVPKAFKDAIASCTFEEGDTLYSTKMAYGTWDEVVDKVDHAIQVHSPARNSSKNTSEDNASVFKANWNTTVKVEFVIGSKPNNKDKFIYTTQGRLFTLLQTGNIEVLNKDNEIPKIPLFVAELKKHINNDAIELIKKNVDEDFDKPNLVIMAYDATNDALVDKFKSIFYSLHEFKPKVIDLSLSKFASLEKYHFHPTLSIKSIVIDSNSPEKIRDIIKKVLWPKRDSKNATKSFCNIIDRTRSVSSNSFKLRNHTLFIPYQVKRHGEIRVHSFNHSPVYRYRLHTTKVTEQNNIPKSLKNYLDLVFADCPNHLFTKTAFRVSKLKMEMSVNLFNHKSHKLIDLAKDSRVYNKFKSRHENLEQYFLDNDKGTIAVELPLWVEEGELQDFKKVFNITGPLVGHIDILRIEDDGKIAVWDYKPNAYKETKAYVQVFLYTYMLSVRTGIKLSDFICGYFDEVDAYQFNPCEAIVAYGKNTTAIRSSFVKGDSSG